MSIMRTSRELQRVRHMLRLCGASSAPLAQITDTPCSASAVVRAVDGGLDQLIQRYLSNQGDIERGSLKRRGGGWRASGVPGSARRELFARIPASPE